MNKFKIFLGGTCADTNWREQVIGMLEFKFYNHIDYFNPVVEDWTPECIEKENEEKEYFCNIHLYHITSETKGFYSIAEAIESTMKGKITIFSVDPTGFDKQQLKSFSAIVDMIRRHSGFAFIQKQPESFSELETILNLWFEDNEISVS